jgi:ribosomal protein S18 acetylase RimI-like enzyme
VAGDVAIRALTIADHRAVATLVRSLDREHARMVPAVFKDDGSDADTLDPEEYQAWLDDSRTGLIGAFHGKASGGTLLGFARVVEQVRGETVAMRGTRRAFVDPIIITVGARRRGIGRRLLAEAEAWASARGCDGIELDVWTGNLGAVGFYQALGFQSLRTRLRKPL